MTSTVPPAETPTPVATSITTPVQTPGATLTPVATSTVAATEPVTPMPTTAATLTPPATMPVSVVPTDPPDPASTNLPVLTTSLPNTGGGPSGAGGSALFLVAAVFLSTLMFAIGWRYRQPGDTSGRDR